MAAELIQAIKGLNVTASKNFDQDICIDEILTDRRRLEGNDPTREELKQQLEKTFLDPPTSFSSEWLDKLQQ